jgi:hypothetical protein
MRSIVHYVLAGFTAAALAAPPPYNESADARADVRGALTERTYPEIPVTLCPDKLQAAARSRRRQDNPALHLPLCPCSAASDNFTPPADFVPKSLVSY